jgi:hypothetical protein
MLSSPPRAFASSTSAVAARRTFGLEDMRRNVVNLVLALLVAIVVGGTIAALIFASGAYPIAR